MEDKPTNFYEYFAFISYCTKDSKEAKRLHKKLEYFKVTSSQASKKGWKRRPLYPTFFAPYEIQPNELSEELKERLRRSKNLVVVCSPNSAKSDWVQWEIEYFISLGRKNKITLFIIDGEPNSNLPEKECYGEAIKEYGLSNLLGANINERIYKIKYLNRERAYIQVITKLLDIGFDTVWNRKKKQLKIKVIEILTLICAFITIICLTMKLSSSFDGSVVFHKTEYKDLFEGDGTLQVILENDTITEIIDCTDRPYQIKNIPGRYHYKDSRIKFKMFGYNDVDTIVRLGKSDTKIPIVRASDIYGHITGKVISDFDSNKPISGAEIRIGSLKVKTNKEGEFVLNVPLRDQKSEFYEAHIKYGNLSKVIKLYPMRRNPEIYNIINLY